MTARSTCGLSKRCCRPTDRNTLANGIGVAMMVSTCTVDYNEFDEHRVARRAGSIWQVNGQSAVMQTYSVLQRLPLPHQKNVGRQNTA